MGRRGGHKSRRGGRGNGSVGQRPNYYPEVKKENEKLERFYNELAIVREDERDLFWETLRRELPNSFRFTGSKGHALTVQQRLIDHYIPEIESVLHFGEKVEPPKPVIWYPNQLAWAMTTPKNVIRRFAPFSSFHKFLVNETLVGNISRQELVSMIPPLLLDVKPGMTVLDMCAAPGSKTAQLIELLHAGDEKRTELIERRIAAGNSLTDPLSTETETDNAEAGGDWSDAGRPTGLLIANDVDYRRAQMLVHQTKRLNSPNLIVTNHDASLFPSLELPRQAGEPARYLKYDRILADVPCSGDGTARKSPNVWKDWDPKNGLGLHIIQSRILVRALQMLKPGGRMVYSTCSMNPVENEAVVAHAIERCGGIGKVRIVDVSDQLPALVRRPGLTNWKVMDKAGKMRSSWEEVEKAVAGGEDAGRVIAEMFPPVEPATEEERVPLERCVRVYPHLQDTGGFFITALEKVVEFRALPEMRANRAKLAAAVPVETDATENGDSAVSPVLKRAAEDESESGVKKARIGDGEAKVVESAAVEETDDKQEVTEKEKKKVEPLVLNAASTASSSVVTPKTADSSRKSTGLQFEEPFVYLVPTHATIDSIYSFYGLAPSFPRDRFMVRNSMGEPVKGIYYTSALVRDVLTANESRGVRFVHSGVKMFQKQDVQGREEVCPWRIQAEGLSIVDGAIGPNRVIELRDRATFQRLLKEMFPRVGNGDEGWTGLGDISQKVRDITMGCCVLRIDVPAGEDGPGTKTVIPLWRSINSVNLMLPKDERRATLIRLFSDNSELVDCSRDMRRSGAVTEAEPSQETATEDAGETAVETVTEDAGETTVDAGETSTMDVDEAEPSQETTETAAEEASEAKE